MITRITAGAKPRAAGGGEEAVVLWLCEGAHGGGGPHQQEVRGLRPEAAKLRAAGGGEEAVVLWLREGARGGGELPWTCGLDLGMDLGVLWTTAVGVTPNGEWGRGGNL